MTKEMAIKTAVKWWVDKLKAKPHHSNGDNSPASIFACALADMGADPLRDDQLKLFAEELTTQIGEYMAKYIGMYVDISCDYGPGFLLRNAAQKAGIKDMNFPFKTYLSIRKRGDEYVVGVRDGYGAPLEELAPCVQTEVPNAEMQ